VVDELLPARVLEDDHRADTIVAWREHTETGDHEIEIAIAIEIDRLDMCGRGNRITDRHFGEHPSWKLANPRHLTPDHIADKDVWESITIKVHDLHVSNLRPPPLGNRIANCVRREEI